jgi:acyl dehydratase
MPTVVDTLDGLTELIGQPLEPSSWVEVGQQRIDAFADATGDHQWIHTDPERAKDGPFGGTIAHGYLTLSLLIPLWTEVLDVREATTKINYGLNRVRFPAPVPAASKLRAAATLAAVDPVAGGAQLTADVAIEIEGAPKPACIAQLLVRFLR